MIFSSCKTKSRKIAGAKCAMLLKADSAAYIAKGANNTISQVNDQQKQQKEIEQITYFSLEY